MDIKLQTVGIVVNNMGETLRFYRTLGLPISQDLDNNPNVDYEMPNGITLGFITLKLAKMSDPKFKKPKGQSMNLQFLVTRPELVDSTYNKLVDAGYKSYAEPWDAFWGQRFARVEDPNGHVVNIYAHL
jgi:catechol 2,3-dioxygenase-like lactoylglutathione lyase family enzyme